MARPKLDAAARRTRIECYLTTAERSAIESKSRRVGLSVSVFLREAALGKRLVALPSVNIDQWQELSKTTANLNQIARRLNMGLHPDLPPALLDTLAAQVQALRQDLLGGCRDEGKT